MDDDRGKVIAHFKLEVQHAIRRKCLPGLVEVLYGPGLDLDSPSMDAPEDRDIWVSRNSSELLSELLDSIPRLTFRKGWHGESSQPRTSLTLAAVNHITRLVDYFQEWPQLLDPKLDAIVSPLNDAFLMSLQSAEGSFASLRKSKKAGLCFPQAISIMLYTLCKVRGAKVIIRFLSNEARHLELILNALEAWTKTSLEKSQGNSALSWEERYILLLWLSHLLLTPFDLRTVGLENFHEVDLGETGGPKLPPRMPSICRRLITLAIDNLSSASKERQSAVLALVRMGLRPDMRHLGLDKELIGWAMTQLKAMQKSKKEAGYKFLALLSFLAAFVKSADTLAISPFLLQIFNTVGQLAVLQSGSSSALTRTAVVKIYSACSTASLSLQTLPTVEVNFAAHILEPAIEELLTALEDNDTPVRQAASKALSVIVTRLDPTMAADISEVVVKSFDENVLWEAIRQPVTIENQSHSARQRNLSLVNPSKWQGLVLTLSQILFRRCAPVTQLPEILNCLILALSFEQRSSTGASLGTNVRDAACFGIWALARRYNTAELLAIDTSSIPSARARGSEGSVIQLLAIELLVAATLDFAGNIRRGASAALQELIGRHPDVVVHGIPLVQIVDYHAIALRSNAMRNVAVSAARLESLYWTAVQTELTSWRGIGAHDVESRRLAAGTLGQLSLFHGLQSFKFTEQVLLRSLTSLHGRTIQKRQGFLLALSSLIRAASHFPEADQAQVGEVLNLAWTYLSNNQIFKKTDLSNHAPHAELWNEAVSLMILEIAKYAKQADRKQRPSADSIAICFETLDFALDRREPVVLENAVDAIKSLIDIAGVHDRTAWIQQMIERTRREDLSAGGMRPGHLLALASIQMSPGLDEIFKQQILQHLLDAATAKTDIDTRVVALHGLTKILSNSLPNVPLPPNVVDAIQIALQDYTTDQRGDVGSLLRLQAIETVRIAFERGTLQITHESLSLMQYVCILAGEKLDKVRIRAWMCLETCWNLDDAEDMDTPPYRSSSRDNVDEEISNESNFQNSSSVARYRRLTQLLRYDSLRVPILQGLFISSGSGSETVLTASRQALAEWLQRLTTVAHQESLVSCIGDIVRNSLENDRVLVPTLDTLAFVLQTNTIRDGTNLSLRWRKLFVLVQKAHFKTTNMAKLLAAVDVYCELGSIVAVRMDVLKKLTSLLTHPFPRVRNAAADALYVLTEEESLKPTDWADSTKYTKQALVIVKEALRIAA